MAAEDDREREVMRLLDRYLVEIVEEYNLCPWAKSARTNGELVRGVLWGTPPVDTWIAYARELLARPNARVVMISAPEFPGTLSELRDVRTEVAKQVSIAGVAEFHPDADLDLATPARLVRFVRRSPDPMLQLVPLDILDGVRTADRVLVDTFDQLELLRSGVLSHVPPVDIAEKIADTNHATVLAATQTIVDKLAAIAADRKASYARAGISCASR